MALEVRRDGRVDDVAHEGLEAENARLRKMYIEEKLKAEIASEALQKVLKPSRRREMAKQVVQQRRVSIRVACTGNAPVFHSRQK